MPVLQTNQKFILIALGLCWIGCKSENSTPSAPTRTAILTVAVKDTSFQKTKSDSLSVDSVDTYVATYADTDTASDMQDLEKDKPSALVKKINQKPKRNAKIHFEQQVWDFGEIIEGEVIEKKFKFTNTGNAPLQIFETSASCGCTLPSFPILDVAPGASDAIGVTYNSVGKNGPQTAEITIKANTFPKVTTLNLKGNVLPKY